MALITAWEGSRGFVRLCAELSEYEICSLSFLVSFLREQNLQRQNKKLARRVQGTLDFLFSMCACFVYIFCRISVRGVNFLDQ